MKRFFIGALAFVGALSVLFVVGLVGLMLLASASKPGVPSISCSSWTWKTRCRSTGRGLADGGLWRGTHHGA